MILTYISTKLKKYKYNTSMKKRTIIEILVGILIVGFWLYSIHLLILKSQGFFIESEQIKKYQKFVQKTLPIDQTFHYMVRSGHKITGVYKNQITSTAEDKTYESKQDLLVNLATLDIPYYLDLKYTSDNNINGDMLDINMVWNLNGEKAEVAGVNFEKNINFDIYYRNKHEKKSIRIPDHYLSMNVLAPQNIEFNKFTTGTNYKLNAMFPNMISMQQEIFIRGVGRERIKMTHGNSVNAYHLEIFSEDKTIQMDIWVDSNNIIKKQTIFDFVSIEIISEETYAEYQKEIQADIDKTRYAKAPDLTMLFSGKLFSIAKMFMK